MKHSQARIKQLAAERGFQLLKSDGSDADAIIATDFAEAARRFLEPYSGYSFTPYRSPVRIYFHFVEPMKMQLPDRHSLDAWVSPVFGEKTHSFVIFVSISLLRSISQVLMSMAVGPMALVNGVTQQQLEQHFPTYVLPRSRAALTFIFLHELSHVVRAHIPFFYTKQYSENWSEERLSFHLIEKSRANITRPGRKLGDIRVHRSMEIDADLLAIGLIHENLSNPATANRFLFDGRENNDPGMFGHAIAIVTRLLEQWRRSVSGIRYSPRTAWHPHPDIRNIFVSSWSLARRKHQDRTPAFVSTAEQFERGYDHAAAELKQFGPYFFPLFEYLSKKGKQEALEEYEILRKDLDNYLRPRLNTFLI